MIVRRLGISGGALLFAAIATPATALDSSFHFKIGYETGGDTLVTVVFVGGETDKIKANEGFLLGAGVSMLNATKDVETEVALSYKFDVITGSNGEVTFSRLPLDALVFYRLPSVRLGGGVTYHLNPDLDGSGVASPFDTSFKNALGFVLQADWRLTEKMNLGLRYTILDYEVESTGAKIDSNGLGIVFSGRL